MNKKLKDILNLFGGGEQKFIKGCFENQMETEVVKGRNFIQNPENKDSVEFYYDGDKEVGDVHGTETATAYHIVEFDGDDYYHGELYYE